MIKLFAILYLLAANPRKLFDQKLFLDKLKTNIPHNELILLIKENRHLLNDDVYKTYRYNFSKDVNSIHIDFR
jgi:hypothetical protein